MDEDETLAASLGVFLFVFGVVILCLAWRRQEEDSRHIALHSLLDVV